MRREARKAYWRIGARMNRDEIKQTMDNLDEEDKKEAIWHMLKGVIQAPRATAADQGNMIRHLGQLQNGELAPFFNASGMPGSEHGERLLQHALMYDKDELVLAILDEPAVSVSFESSELRSTPLHLALLNDLSFEVIEKLVTPFSIERKNSQNKKPEDIAIAKGNEEFLTLLASRKLTIDGGPGFFQPDKATETHSGNLKQNDTPTP